jgi:hypothetical protein
VEVSADLQTWDTAFAEQDQTGPLLLPVDTTTETRLFYRARRVAP